MLSQAQFSANGSAATLANGKAAKLLLRFLIYVQFLYWNGGCTVRGKTTKRGLCLRRKQTLISFRGEPNPDCQPRLLSDLNLHLTTSTDILQLDLFVTNQSNL